MQRNHKHRIVHAEFGGVCSICGLTAAQLTPAKTYHLGEIMRLFDLETAGDAWDLVFERGWEHVQPLPDTKWQFTIPPEDLPVAES